jgi:iron complex transport system substrate-binding protein
MKKSAVRVKFISWAFMFLLACAFCGYAQEDYPQRIISLGPSITESLYLLGAKDSLVGVTSYCVRPPEAQEKEKTGTVIDVNVEKAVSLKPDLVIATSLTDQKAVEKLRSLGITVVTFFQPKNFSEVCNQFMKLAKLLGKEKEAAGIISAAESKVKYIEDKVANLSKPKVFIQVGAKPLFTMTSDSFVNDFIEFAGGINIAKEARSGLYSREEVLRKNPDVIIIVTMGIAGEKEKEIWAKYKTLNAAKANRIYIIDSYKLCSPTPVSFAESLEEIAYILHPEIKGE